MFPLTDDVASQGSHASRDAPAPENPEVQKSISALLTPYLAAKLSRGDDSHQVRLGVGFVDNGTVYTHHQP